MIDSNILSDRLREFSSERDWDQFHTPKNIAASISVEASELLEIFQWSRGQNGWDELHDPKIKKRVEEELADILLYLLRFADLANIDLQKAAESKLILNEKKYPVETFKGSDKKYNE